MQQLMGFQVTPGKIAVVRTHINLGTKEDSAALLEDFSDAASSQIRGRVASLSRREFALEK